MSNRYKILPLALTLLIVLAATASAKEISFKRAFGRHGLNPQRTSIAVADARTGALLATHQADLQLNPASCMKIITAVAALAALGPDYHFETRLSADRAPDAAGRVGTLYLWGNGDPMLVSERVWTIAAALRSRGVESVKDIVVDDRFFDGASYPRRAGADSRACSAPTSAVAMYFNTITVRVSPGHASGAPARAALEPPVATIRLVNRAKTGGKGTKIAVTRKASKEGDIITVSGTIASNAESAAFPKSITQPARYAGSVLRHMLLQNGITVTGKVRRGSAPKGAVLLTTQESRPLAELVRSMNKFSNNFMAEQILKHLGAIRVGRPGSTAKGVAVLADHLKAAGIDPAALALENGSGYSDQTRISAQQLVAILVRAYRDFSLRPELIASLPILGVDGTARRYKAAPAVRGRGRGKTGTLNGVTSLAGYVPMADGRIAAYAILANGLKVGPWKARQAEMEVVRAIAEATP